MGMGRMAYDSVFVLRAANWVGLDVPVQTKEIGRFPVRASGCTGTHYRYTRYILHVQGGLHIAYVGVTYVTDTRWHSRHVTDVTDT